MMNETKQKGVDEATMLRRKALSFSNLVTLDGGKTYTKVEAIIKEH